MRRLYTVFILLFACCAMCVCQAQRFTVDTAFTATGALDTYHFTLNYLQSGLGQPLQGNIYQWAFFLDAGTPEPTNIISPTGWQHKYEPSTGEFDWYTEGPAGYANGDYGPYVLRSGNSLGGFALGTPLLPGLSVAFASDTQQNSDLNFATVPAFAPVSVPEVGPLALWAALGIFSPAAYSWIEDPQESLIRHGASIPSEASSSTSGLSRL